MRDQKSNHTMFAAAKFAGWRAYPRSARGLYPRGRHPPTVIEECLMRHFDQISTHQGLYDPRNEHDSCGIGF
ncbi:MAG: hypothetical protein KDJ22_14450, partial [Candidatus Competibacteraceae bacterium]|nr:hypothetical protein [Candidatus Competibacteraceae bacterium]